MKKKRFRISYKKEEHLQQKMLNFHCLLTGAFREVIGDERIALVWHIA